jgi:hypothetical protein
MQFWSSVAKTKIVFFRFENLERPVLKVVEKIDQVAIVIRSEANEHLTLHREANGTVLLTHWTPDKPRGTWDATRIEVARRLGYRNAERHAHYLTHRPLFPVQGMDGHELCGRRVILESATAKRKYVRAPHIVIDAPAREFMLTFHLATPEQPYSAPEEPHIATGFGDLHFRPTA